MRKDLFVFKWGLDTVIPFKYRNFTNKAKLVKKSLAELPNDNKLEYYSVANHDDKRIVLSGGRDYFAIPSDKVYALDLI